MCSSDLISHYVVNMIKFAIWDTWVSRGRTISLPQRTQMNWAVVHLIRLLTYNRLEALTLQLEPDCVDWDTAWTAFPQCRGESTGRQGCSDPLFGYMKILRHRNLHLVWLGSAVGWGCVSHRERERDRRARVVETLPAYVNWPLQWSVW